MEKEKRKKYYIENKTLQELEYEWRERYEEIMSNFHEHGYITAKETLATYRYYQEQASKYYDEIQNEFIADCKRYGINEPFE